MNNCTQCHSGSVNSGNGSIVFTNLPESYIPGETYSIGVEVSGHMKEDMGFKQLLRVEMTLQVRFHLILIHLMLRW